MIERLGARAIAGIIAGLVAIVIVWAAFHFWGKSRSQGAQSRVDQAQTTAGQQSVGDAVNTVTGVGTNATSSEDMTRQNEKEIRNAQGANDPVNPAARDAGLRGLCRRAAYRDSPKCRVFQPPAR